MRKLFLPIVFLFFCVSPLAAQDALPTRPPVSSSPERPLKPEKDPVTAPEYYEAARWANWNGTSNPTPAIALLDKAIELNPEYSEAYHLRGILKDRQGRTKEAIIDYDNTIRLDPEAVNTYQLRGECKTKLKDYAGALADMDMSVALLASKKLIQYNAFENRGRVKYMLGSYDAAIEDFNNAIRTGRGQGAFFLRALTYIKKGDTASAIRELTMLADYYEKIAEEVREKYPTQSSEKEEYPFNENPLATLKKPKVSKSSATFELIYVSPQSRGMGAPQERSIGGNQFAEFEDKLDPDKWFFPSDKKYFMSYTFGDPDVIYYLLGDFYEKAGDAANAIKSFTSSIRAKGFQNEPIYYRRGKLRLKSNEFEPAVRDFSWVIAALNKPPDAYLERGIAIFMLGHDQLAQKDFDKYLALSPQGKAVLDARLISAKKLRKELQDQKTASQQVKQ